MKTFLVTFTVDGRRVQQEVRASTAREAKLNIEAQYSGSRVAFANVKDLSTGNYVM